MKKKLISSLMSVAMVAGLLAGCGSASSTDGGTEPAAEAEGTEAEAGEGEAAEGVSSEPGANGFRFIHCLHRGTRGLLMSRSVY